METISLENGAYPIRVKACESGTIFIVGEVTGEIVSVSEDSLPALVEFLSRFL